MFGVPGRVGKPPDVVGPKLRFQSAGASVRVSRVPEKFVPEGVESDQYSPKRPETSCAAAAAGNASSKTAANAARRVKVGFIDASSSRNGGKRVGGRSRHVRIDVSPARKPHPIA